MSKVKNGIIRITGENTEYQVNVTKWWKKGDYYNKALEVKTDEDQYFRETKKYGWRRYNKLTVPKYNNDKNDINFFPNITKNCLLKDENRDK